jgi:hypothetical protein
VQAARHARDECDADPNQPEAAHALIIATYARAAMALRGNATSVLSKLLWPERGILVPIPWPYEVSCSSF